MATLMAMAVQARHVGLDDDEDGMDDEPPQPN
jgi:hypothetical protein